MEARAVTGDMLKNCNEQAIPWVNPNKKGKKLDIMHDAGELLEEEIFPENKSCRDIPCCCLFALMVLFVAGVGGYCAPNLSKYVQNAVSPTVPPPNATTTFTTTPNMSLFFGGALGANGVALPTKQPSVMNHLNLHVTYAILGPLIGSVFAFFSVLALVVLAKKWAKCVVYTALLFSAILMILMGIAMICVGAANPVIGALTFIMGGIMILIGVCFVYCILFCYGGLVAFTAHIVELVAAITLDNTGMFLVAVVGGVQSIIWSLLTFFALLAFLATIGWTDSNTQKDKYTSYAVYGTWFFCYQWGVQLIAGVCYTTFCGVFGRWYFSSIPSKAHEYGSGCLCSSYITAQIWNFGSICFGTGLVSAIRTAEFIARMAQNDAQQEGNIVMCIVLLCVRCCLECLGDLLEFFNEFGYVQCALRNLSYCESVKLTFGLFTFRNAMAIISAWLVDSVVNMGGFLAGVIGGLVAGGIGFLGSPGTALMACIFGLFVGNGIGWCCLSVFTAGAKTLVTCWCEHPESLFKRAQVHDEFDKEDTSEFLPKSIYEEFRNKANMM